MEDGSDDNLSKEATDLDVEKAKSENYLSATDEEGRPVRWRGESLLISEGVENVAPTFESGSRNESQESSWYGESTRSFQSSSERSEFLLAPDDLDGSSRLSSAENRASELEERALRPKSSIRRSTALGVDGVARINLSPLTQKIVGCVIGENVTTEYPWIYVKKDTIEDNIDLHDQSSDFLPIKDAVLEFPDAKMLIGYAPSSVEEGQFYVCITKSARDAVIRGINVLRCEQEDRVRNAIYKTVGTWDSLGSEAEVNDNVVRNTRPLFVIEIVRSGDSLNLPFDFTDRGPSDQRDGYAELLPYRQQTFEHAPMKLVERGDQVTPETRDNEAQTDRAVLANAWTRYEYAYPAIINTEAYNDGEAAAMKEILDRYTDNICDEVTINETWDIYANDYANLVRSSKDTVPPEVIVYAEHQSYSGGKLCKDRVVNSLSWHPYWSGVAAVAYTDHGKMETLNKRTERDEVMRACHESNHVLIWSFTDCLRPKLVLESPREVTVVSFCPLEGNVIVGGCANGQIAIWDVTDKIEKVETVVVRTPAQAKYEVAMRNLMWWTQEAKESAALRPDAMSSLQHSHSAAITEIAWVPAYNKMDKNGRITRLRAETPADELTWQFVTSCEDGTVAFWDLKSKPRGTSVGQLRSRWRKRVPRPEPLIQATSPYKILDRLLEPDYRISVRLPVDNVTCLPLTCASSYFPDFRLVRIQPEPDPRKDLATRLYYHHAIEAPDYEMEPSLLLGSVDGHLLRIAWDGYEFSTGLTINDEVARIADRTRIHDGPVTAIVRSKYSRNLLITIGGKIFALWREDKMIPILWRKSTFKYTAGCWGSVRPTVILMGRSDGSIEAWDLRIDSKLPVLVQSMSGRPITGMVIHKLPIPVPCIAFFDYNGILRVCTAPESMLRLDTADIEWFDDFCSREIERIEEFRAWQSEWSVNNAERLKRRRILAEIDAEKQRLARLNEIDEEMAAAAANERKADSEKEIRKPGAFLRKANARWKSMELRRMHRVILDKKGLLSRADLEKRRTPLANMRDETRRKEKKMRDILQLQNRIFQNAIAFLFPDQYYQQDAITEATLATGTDRSAEDSKELLDTDVVLPTESQPRFATTEEELVYQFLSTQAEALAAIHDNPYKHTFVWRRVLAEGRRRRTALDPLFARRTRHRRMYVTDVSAEPPRKNIAWFDEEGDRPETGEIEREASRQEERSEGDVAEESTENSSEFGYFNEANKSPSRR